MKRCTKCKQEKSTSEFGKHPQARDGLNPSCKSCRNIQQRALYKTRKPEWTEERQASKRDTFLRSKYGIGSAEYEEMYKAQDGKCGICKDDYPVLCVDHCHDSLAVRGLLCRRCNLGLGYFLDSKERLENAMGYLNSC